MTLSKTVPARTIPANGTQHRAPSPASLTRESRVARICQRCYARNEAGDTFCKVCGEELPDSLADVDSDATRRLVPVAQRAQLVVESGSEYGAAAEFWLEKDVSLVGRGSSTDGVSPDVDLVNLDTSRLVSRRHAFILKRHGGFVLEDLESANGTYLNGIQRLQPHAQTILRDGDQITFGETRCVFWTEAPSGLIESTPEAQS